jgi:hypothetical protein
MTGGELAVGAAIGILSFWGGAVAAVVGAKAKAESPEAKRLQEQLVERERLLTIANRWKNAELDQGGALLRAAARILELAKLPPLPVYGSDAISERLRLMRDAEDDLAVAYYAIPVEYRELAAAGEPVPTPSGAGVVQVNRHETVLDSLEPMIRKGEALVVGPDGKLSIQGEKPCAVPLCEHGRHDEWDLGRAAGTIAGFALTHSRITRAGKHETWASVYSGPADPRIPVALALARGATLTARGHAEFEDPES